jgi:uncharacterized protein
MESYYMLAFTTGLLGGMGHCIGMCGPIVASYAFHGSSPADNRPVMQNIIPHLAYNAGRITTYMFAGAVMGLTGSFINNISGFRNIVTIAAGLMMILMGTSISGFFGGTDWLERHNSYILRVGRKLLQGKSLWRYYPLGLLLGFLPCGFSYAAFVAAAGTGSLFSGLTLMLLFGLGTLPSLLLFGFAASSISSRLRGILYKAAGVIVIVMGCLFILKGIRLYAQV